MPDHTELLELAEELYASPIDAFTSTRNARVAAAKKAGDRELAATIAGLPKPSAAAWASNLLVRSATSALDELTALRDDISTATSGGDRDALRALAGRRHELIERLVADARGLAEAAGKPLSAAVTSELTDALTATLADAETATAVSTGRLVSTPQSGGMTRSDLAAIVALPPEALTAPSDAESDEDDTVVEPRGKRYTSRVGAKRPSRTMRATGATGATGDSAGASRSPGSRRTSSRTTRGDTPTTSPRTGHHTTGPSAAERRRHRRDLEAAERRAEAARADREARESKRDDLATRRDEVAAELAQHQETLRALERRLDDATEAVEALTADIRSRELEWKRAEAAERAARRVAEADDEPSSTDDGT